MLDVSRSDLVTGVAGSGTMGRGIAQVLAQCGVRTLVFDSLPGAAHKARDSIAQALGKLGYEIEKAMVRMPEGPLKMIGDHKVEVAAYRFSATVREKVEKAGGSVITIEELIKKNPRGSKVRLMG